MTAFRRGYRVRSIANGSLGGMMGTVLNPAARHGTVSNRPLMTVRFDSQQEYENGYEVYESEVVLDTSGETQFDRRNYQVWLSHHQVAAIKLALSYVNHRDDTLTDERIQELLTQLPKLPA